MFAIARAWVLLIAPALFAHSARAQEVLAPLHPDTAKIVLHGGGTFGSDIEMDTLVYKPDGAGPFPVLLFLHGRAGDAPTRRQLRTPLSSGQVRYWLRHGLVVVAPIRPGYGTTGGPDRENDHASFQSDGRCTGKPDYRPVAQAAVVAVMASLDWLRQQPWADARRVVIEGQSVGGFASVAAGAAQLPGVLGYINFAGGAGGSPERAPGHSCDPGQLTTLYGEWGRSTKVPNVWIYAQNDQYWGPDAPRGWHAAFAAGGSATSFVSAPPVEDGDGHGLSRHASKLWAHYLDDFLARSGVLATDVRNTPPSQ